jgi:ABC-type lipoprotein export system ATPase subunit
VATAAVAMNTRSAVVLREVRKSYAAGDGGNLEVLNVKYLALPAAGCTVLRGRSGSGKTTLLNLIAGVALPSAGTIEVKDTDLFALSEARRDRFRAEHIGYVFQSFNLLAAFSALENVMLAMLFAEIVPKRVQRPRAGELLARLGLAGRLAHKPQHLSRGEQQRVAIARALANDPPIILADEPCASLDLTTATEVMAAFLAVCREDGKTLLMVSHEEAALRDADQVIDMAELNRAETGKYTTATASQ